MHAGPVGKKDFPQMLKVLVQEAFKEETVKAGFRACGICPFNDHAVVLEETPQAAQCPCAPEGVTEYRPPAAECVPDNATPVGEVGPSVHTIASSSAWSPTS